jgi:phosphatidylserine/phosphatidylglycerophosphate/cardiolipin synthase-like enzyme
MTSTPYQYGNFSAQIQLLPNPYYIEALHHDLAYAHELFILAYEIGVPFFIRHFGPFLASRPIWLAADARNTQDLRSLLTQFPNLHASVWAPSAQLHIKALVIPSQGISYLGSHNLTQYSVGHGQNLTLRIDSQPFATHLQAIVESYRRRAMPLTPLAPDEIKY